MKKTLAFVAIMALVLAVFAVSPLPSAKAGASEAEVLSYSWYTAPAGSVLAQNPGDVVVVGEIQNVGSNIIQNVTLAGTAYDSSGNAIATAEGTAFTYETTPGAKAPFSIDFTPQSSTTSNTDWMSDVANFSVSVLSVFDTTAQPYAGLQVPNVGGSPAVYSLNNSDIYTVVGTIVNKGTQTVNYVWVVTTFYNAAGTVVALNFTDYLVSPSAALAPGEAARWVATPADNTAQLTDEIAGFSYVIDSSLLTSLSSPQPTPTPVATPAPSQFPLLPLVVVIVVAVVVAAALVFLRKREKLPPPPPPPPPPPMDQELSIFNPQ